MRTSQTNGSASATRSLFAAIFRRVQPMVFGETTARRLPHPPALLPVFVHLGLVLVLGLFIPSYLADWFRLAAKLISGS